MQCPAVIARSGPISVTVQVDRFFCGSSVSTCRIIPTPGDTVARTSPVAQAAFSHFGGSAQYQNGSYFGSV